MKNIRTKRDCSRDADGVDVGKELLRLSHDELLEPIRSALLHTLEHHLEVDGHLGVGLGVRLDDL